MEEEEDKNNNNTNNHNDNTSNNNNSNNNNDPPTPVTVESLTNTLEATHVETTFTSPQNTDTQQAQQISPSTTSVAATVLPPVNEVVTLNVGGFEYSTLRRTLLKVPLFSQLFQNESLAIKDNKGRYFIDRDGRLFSYILQYLRTGVAVMPETIVDMDMLRIELDFYKLEDFGRKLTEHIKRLRAQKDNHDIVRLNVGGRSFVTTRRTMIVYPNSLLARIFNGNQPNEYFCNGEVFFDRDPEMFSHVLQFLRNKTLSYSCTSMQSKDFLHNLLCEARFFKLEDLIGICMSLIRYCDQS